MFHPFTIEYLAASTDSRYSSTNGTRSPSEASTGSTGLAAHSPGSVDTDSPLESPVWQTSSGVPSPVSSNCSDTSKEVAQTLLTLDR